MADTPTLWTFSLTVYAHPGVAEACLHAQDALGQDVNLLLWAAWVGAAHGHGLSGGEVAAARAAVAPWSESVVLPLRALRRGLKAGPPPAPSPATDALRERVKALELEAERIEQDVLSAHPAVLRPGPVRAAALRANVGLLLPPGADMVTDRLCAAVGEAFPGMAG
ncbi:TIGR02444 family protein [Aerophototrophica crusticola]|uniref:TIGR02444 family protein n=1 Tax=Aerophototrophica crusticola TaxID=1709002 RepID=A0A858R4P5_9PROT|nr:TIGR02444 family protein [Rhodospirillaceae bacterium B3]